MKNLKILWVCTVMILLVFAISIVFRIAAAPKETLELRDVTGQRAYLNDFVISGVLTDHLHDVAFRIEDGTLTKSYAQFDSGLSNPLLEVDYGSDLVLSGHTLSMNYAFTQAPGAKIKETTIVNDDGKQEAGVLCDKVSLVIEIIGIPNSINGEEGAASREGEKRREVMTDITVTAMDNSSFYLVKDKKGKYIYDYSEPQALIDGGVACDNETLLSILSDLSADMLFLSGDVLYFCAAGNSLFEGTNALFAMDVGQNTFGEMRILNEQRDLGQVLYLNQVNGRILVVYSKNKSDNGHLTFGLYDMQGTLLDTKQTEYTGVLPGAICTNYFPENTEQVCLGLSGGLKDYFMRLRLRDTIDIEWIYQTVDESIIHTKFVNKSGDKLARIFVELSDSDMPLQSDSVFVEVRGEGGDVLYLGELLSDSYQDYQTFLSPIESGWLFSELLGQATFLRNFTTWNIGGAS